MTIVTYRDGIMASDSFLSEDGVNSAAMRKVVRTKRGYLAGAAGNADDVAAFIKWMEGGGARAKVPAFGGDSFSGLLVKRNKPVICYDGGFESPYDMTGDFFAIGSGMAAALGAMHAGASAIDAVSIAIKLCHGCGGEMQIVRLKEP